MNPSFSPYQALLWVGASPTRIVAALVVLFVVAVCAPAGFVVYACAVWRRVRRVARWVADLARPWLRFAAWSYLTKDRDVEPVHCWHAPAQHPAGGLLAAPELLLLDVGPDEADDDVSSDREPEPVTVSQTFGPASFGWFELPHREPAGPSRVELAEDIELVLTLASRFTRAAAEGGGS